MMLNDQVAEHDAVLVAEPRARQDHRRQAGVGQVYGQAGRNQHGLARMQLDRGFDAGTQVETSSAGRGVVRRGVLEARVENLDVDLMHGGSP